MGVVLSLTIHCSFSL